MYDLIIIGFGISGISLAKEAIKRNKNILILEKEISFGGVWFKCHKKCELQTHKDYYEFSDEYSFECSSHYPNKNEILNYLEKIIDKYQITKHVIYNYKVKSLKKNDNYYIINDEFKALNIGICSGQNNKEKHIDKLNKYTGKIIYNTKFFDFNNIKNKNILVLGNGATACDVIKNINNADPTNNIICVYKHNKYFIDKYIFGIPISIFLNNLILRFFKNLNLAFYRIIIKLVFLLFFKNTLNIPIEKINSTNLIGSNIILKKIKDGNLIYVKDEIEFVDKKNIIFSNNIFLNIDYIFCCNGYINDNDFLEIPKERYLGIFNEKYKNIGFIGFNPSYNWPKICEKQSNIFLDFIDKKMNINKSYSKKIIDNDFTYYLYDFLKL